MNQISYHKPTQVYQSDTCPKRMGGYNHKGYAWQKCLPEDLKFRASINLLKHLAGVISPWTNILAGRLKNDGCTLSMTDSTTTKGWLWKTNFKDNIDNIQASFRIEVARSHASRYMHNRIREYSQWFPGTNNKVADALSCKFDRTDDKVTQILFTHVPSQTSPREYDTFKILPLPNKIIIIRFR